MERSILGEENQQASDSDLVAKSVGSAIKIDSISIDLVGTDKIDLTGKCDHFSIRGFVSEVRKKNWKLCWPFALNENDDKPEEETCALPSLHVSKFRWWRCQNCLREMYSEGNTDNCGNGSNYCSNTRFKSSETCSHVSSLGDGAMVQSDFEQAPYLKVVDGKVDASIATDLNVNDWCPTLDSHKNGKKSEATNTRITGHEIGQEYLMNQENPVSASAAPGVPPGLMTGRRHTLDLVVLNTNCNHSVEFFKPGSESHEVADLELANGNVKCVFKKPAEVFQTGKQPSSEEKHSKLMLACGTSRVEDIVEKVVDAAKGLIVEHSSPELDECDNVSYESDETLSEDCLQDLHHDSSNGSHRKKVRKIRLLTELLAENGDARANLTTTDNSLSNSIPNSSAGTDLVSAVRVPVAFQGNSSRVLDQSKKRKFPDDEEQGPAEISSPNSFYKITGACNGSAETPGILVNLDAKESTSMDLQIGVKSNLNKFTPDRSPTCQTKNESPDVDEFLSLAPSEENIAEDKSRIEDANKVSAADAILFKSAENAHMNRAMYPFPLPPQKTERNSSISKKKSKMPQFDGGQPSLTPWSSGILTEGPITRKDVEIKQLNTIISPFQSNQHVATGQGLHLSLNSYFSAQEYDGRYISPFEHRQLPLQTGSSKENGVIGKDIQRNYVGNSNYPSKSEVDAFLLKGVHCDLSMDNNHRVSFLNQKQKSTSQVEAGGYSLMQPMDFYGRGSNGKSMEMQEQTLTTKSCDQQVDKMSEQGVPDDIPMEIVELMAKNQYERCLPDIENEKQRGTTINSSNAPIFGKGSLSFLSDKSARRPKSRAKNGRNGKIARTENGETSKGKSGACFSHIDRKHFNMNPLEQAYCPTRFLPFSQCQVKAPNGIKFSDTSSSKHSSSQNFQWIESILGHRSSQPNLQTMGARNSCQNVPQQNKEAAHLWPSMIPSHVPIIYDIPQKHASRSTNIDMLSHCSSLHKGNVNSNHNLNFLNIDVTNIEKHNRTFDSESLSRPHAEYPFACKHSGMGSLDLYSNETIPAMHLLSLMDAGLPSGPPVDIDTNHKFLKRPSFPHDHHSKDLSGLSSGGYKSASTTKPSPHDFYGKNHLSEKTQECFPAVQTVGTSGFSFQHDKVIKKITGFTGQASLKSQGRGKAKASDLPSQIKDSRSQQSVFIPSCSGTSHGAIPVHNMQKMFLATSDSTALPLQFQVMETAAKHKSEARNITSTVLPPKTSINTEICSVNRNPADFTVPEAGNVYMIRGEDLKCRKPVFCQSRFGSMKPDGRKRQKKLTSMKGKV